MRVFRSYLRTILLSILAAIVIDTIIHYEEYKHDLVSNINHILPSSEDPIISLSGEIGKATSYIINIFR